MLSTNEEKQPHWAVKNAEKIGLVAAVFALSLYFVFGIAFAETVEAPVVNEIAAELETRHEANLPGEAPAFVARAVDSWQKDPLKTEADDWGPGYYTRVIPQPEVGPPIIRIPSIRPSLLSAEAYRVKLKLTILPVENPARIRHLLVTRSGEEAIQLKADASEFIDDSVDPLTSYEYSIVAVSTKGTSNPLSITVRTVSPYSFAVKQYRKMAINKDEIQAVDLAITKALRDGKTEERTVTVKEGGTFEAGSKFTVRKIKNGPVDVAYKKCHRKPTARGEVCERTGTETVKKASTVVVIEDGQGAERTLRLGPDSVKDDLCPTHGKK